MNLDLLQLIADSGVALFVTVILLYWNRMDAKDRLEEMRQQIERERQMSERERADKALMIETVRNNTEVLAEVLTIVKRLNGEAT